MARFQEFRHPTYAMSVAERIAALRSWLAEAHADALLVPRESRYLGEWLHPADERLAWATGFTGSAGLCLLQPSCALLLVDGRYREQASQQTDPALFTVSDIARAPLAQQVAQALEPKAVLAYDPWLHTEKFVAELRAQELRLKAVDPHPVDSLWHDRPGVAPQPIRIHPPALAGSDHADKRASIAAALRKDGLDGAFLGAAESVNWLFNLRGSDVPRTPIAQLQAILRSDGSAVLFVDPERVDGELASHLGSDVDVAEPNRIADAAARLCGSRIRVDPQATPERVWRILEDAGVKLARGTDPAALPKACKNKAELSGMREAHLLDGAAMVTFLHWLDGQDPASLTEIDLAEELERRRIATGALDDIAFDTISASGPNAALPHYRVTEDTNRRLHAGEFVLLDSGGQYRMGTTDITRTIALGEVPDELREAYTRVLAGMLRLASQRFPAGTTGGALDALARQFLWQHGQDYAHGTGHGVGACLSVHEGPQVIGSGRGRPGTMCALKPGMVLSDEPGVYVPGKFGVRIENLLVVMEDGAAQEDSTGMLAFETLTHVPIDRRPIVPELLAPSERKTLNAYHARVLQAIGPRVGSEVRNWLVSACAPF